MWIIKQLIVDNVDNYVHMWLNGDFICGKDCGEIKWNLAYIFERENKNDEQWKEDTDLCISLSFGRSVYDVFIGRALMGG